MNVQQRGLLVLIRSGLTGEKLSLPDGFDLDAAYEDLVRHQIMALGYLGALNCGVSRQRPIMDKLFQSYCLCLQHSESQTAFIDQVCAAFDEAGVDYMPLKGCNVRHLYPAPELRTMADSDILIRVEQYDAIRPILQKLNFEECYESDHELVWKKGAVVLELHKRLIPSYNKDYHRYFGDGWRLARVERGTRYAMEKEDEFVYLFTHFAKHYRDGGIGLRHLADLWVWLQAYPQMDMTYIHRELEQLELNVFFGNVRKTIEAWLGNGEWDDLSRFIAFYICTSGAYGTHAARKLAAVVRESGGKKSAATARYIRVGKLVFLPLRAMAQKYPVLERVPILLPVFWIVRAIDVMLFRRRSIQRMAQDFHTTNRQAVDTYQQSLDRVGLFFKFEE